MLIWLRIRFSSLAPPRCLNEPDIARASFCGGHHRQFRTILRAKPIWTMQHILDKLITHLYVVVLLAAAFFCSMVGFWLRIRRDENRRIEKSQTSFKQCVD